MNQQRLINHICRRYYSALVFIFISLWCVSAHAEVNSGVLCLEVKGSAAINQNGVVGARDEAIREALYEAIQEASSALLSLPVVDENFQPVRNALIGERDKYVNNYKITAEGQREEIYFVVANVSVALTDLKNYLVKAGFRQVSGKRKSSVVIFLDVKGLRQYSDYLFLKGFLKKQAKNVKRVLSRSFEWQKVYLELEILDTPQVLAVELAQTGRYVLEAGRINDNRITVINQEEGKQ